MLGYDSMLGTIDMVGFNYAPTNTAFCQGQIMSINQNTALFCLLGTFYGGNGVTTYNLPDLRGRMPMMFNPSSYNYPGQTGGYVSQTLTSTSAAAPGDGDTTIQVAQGGQTIDTLPPYLTINFVIAIQGIWPSRS